MRRKGKAKPHPYKSYEHLPLWSVVSKAATELVNNGDLRETTPHPYIVGYICKSIGDAEELAARS